MLAAPYGRVINTFPDHMHEGDTVNDNEVELDKPLDIPGYERPEYPFVELQTNPGTATAGPAVADDQVRFTDDRRQPVKLDRISYAKSPSGVAAVGPARKPTHDSRRVARPKPSSEKMEAKSVTEKNQGGRVHNTALEFLRRGEKVPKAFLERRIAAATRQLAERAKARQAIGQRYATDWNHIQEASKDGDDRRAQRAMQDVLKIHKDLARNKMAASARIGLGGMMSTSVFGVKITPPSITVHAH